MPVIKGKHFHKFENETYDVDTPYDSLVWEEIIPKDDRLIHRIWRYNQDAFPCPSCMKTDMMQYNIQSTGVMGKCTWCNITLPIPPRDLDKNEDIADMIFEEQVNNNKAFEIAERIGQELPDNIRPERRSDRKRRLAAVAK